MVTFFNFYKKKKEKQRWWGGVFKQKIGHIRINTYIYFKKVVSRLFGSLVFTFWTFRIFGVRPCQQFLVSLTNQMTVLFSCCCSRWRHTQKSTRNFFISANQNNRTKKKLEQQKQVHLYIYIYNRTEHQFHYICIYDKTKKK